MEGSNLWPGRTTPRHIPEDDWWFHAHAHSHYSTLDGMPPVSEMVAKAKANGQKALALTDHGNMSGVAELYRSCREAGIAPFPGEEFYLVNDVSNKDAKRYHITMLAYTDDGYQALVKLSSLSHDRSHYHYRPRIDFNDLRMLDGVDGVVALTGCFFGVLQQPMVEAWETANNKVTRSVINTGVKIAHRLALNIPTVLVEVQHHNNVQSNGLDDDTLLEMLWEVSFETGLPMIVTQDSHYTHLKHKPLHDLMKQIAYHGSDDSTFPGDSYHLARTKWVKEHFVNSQKGNDAWVSSLVAMRALIEKNTLYIEPLEKYSYHVPTSIKDPLHWLISETTGAMQRMGLTEKKYVDRHAEEIAVISELGMAGYFRLIWEGVQFAKTNHIMVNARGSANASLICYLLGITHLDPIKWRLMFERFLSRDRKKPPDVDLDIEDVRRGDVVEFYKSQYDVTQIGTFNTLGEDVHGKGSILVQYMGWARRTYKKLPDALEGVRYIDDLPKDVQVPLRELGEMRVKKSYGAHAAGYVLGTPDQTIEDFIPTMLIPSSGLRVTQFTMDDVEAMGFIKVDLLGQRTLTTVKRTLELIGRDPSDGLDWIPDDDPAAMKHLREGRSNTGVFQFEGWAAAKGCRDLAVRKVRDCIAIMALYRPAVMASGYLDIYLNNRRRITTPEYPHPSFKQFLQETHGVAIYQEQVMSILRHVGVPYLELNEFLSALKMSNHKAPRAQRIFREQRSKFIKLAVIKGMTKEEAEGSWDYIAGFAGYGFNRAHATAYGLLGYRTAYLKTHHPLEFMAALLETTAGSVKEHDYVSEARRIGIPLLGADVNRSQAVWTLDSKRGAIRKGLTSIKGVGLKAAEEIVSNAPYQDLTELISKCDRRLVTGGSDWDKSGQLKGVLEALRNGGALRTLGVDPY